MPAVIDERFQGFCAVSSDEGYLDEFDHLPPRARELLREAPFNICPACYDQVRRYLWDEGVSDGVLVGSFIVHIQSILDGKLVLKDDDDLLDMISRYAMKRM